MITYEISKNAKFELEDIWFWTIENFSEKLAENYHFSIEIAIRNLCVDLEKKIVVENQFEQFNYIRHKSHYIFYVHQSEEKIKIIRILHQNRKFTKFLK